MPICPHCAAELSQRQIRRHLAARQRVLEAHLDAVNEAGAGPAPPDDAGPAPPNDADIALDDVDLEFDNADLDLEIPGPAPRDNSPAPSDDQPAHRRRIDIADLIAREEEGENEDEEEDVGKLARLLIVSC
jgi:hypothetical protein